MKNKKDECISQVVEMLRSYNQEPENDSEAKMANTIFEEMLQYLSKKDVKELQKQYHRER